MVRVGFVGLGLMGEPMAHNLARAGVAPLVWNRTASKAARVRAAGARVAATPEEVFGGCDVIVEMLADESAIDAVFGKCLHSKRRNLAGRTVIHMSTTSPDFSVQLRDTVARAGGSYVEAPVSGSRIPAERAQLVTMVAGDPAVIEQVRPVLTTMCHTMVVCGAVPVASQMKLVVNTFLVTMVTGLAETVALAAAHQLPAEALSAIIDAGPMSSDASRTKLAKLLSGNLEPQAAVTHVLDNCRLAVESTARPVTPLMGLCRELYSETVELGYGAADMVSVIKAIEARAVRSGVRDDSTPMITRSGPPNVHPTGASAQ